MKIQEWMQGVGFENCETRQVEHLVVRVEARDALEQGQLNKGVTSQLAVLSDKEYRRGIDSVAAEIERADNRGESLYLNADLRLYSTTGVAGLRRR
jgi:hypothetical protein